MNDFRQYRRPKHVCTPFVPARLTRAQLALHCTTATNSNKASAASAVVRRCESPLLLVSPLFRTCPHLHGQPLR